WIAALTFCGLVVGAFLVFRPAEQQPAAIEKVVVHDKNFNVPAGAASRIPDQVEEEPTALSRHEAAMVAWKERCAELEKQRQEIRARNADKREQYELATKGYERAKAEFAGIRRLRLGEIIERDAKEAADADKISVANDLWKRSRDWYRELIADYPA